MATRPIEIFPPGDFLREELEARGWTQTDLADILGRPFRVVNEIIAGKRGISPETANGLAEALGTSAELWLNLDAAYQLHVSGEPDPSVALRARVYSRAPVREMVKRHWIEYSSNPKVLEQRLLEFFGVEDLGNPPTVMPAAARMSTSYEALTPSHWAWLCRARQLGNVLSVQGNFDPRSSAGLLEKLGALMSDPEDVRHVPRVLAEAGIRFVVVEHLAKTRIDGACLWLDKKSPIIVISLRYDRIDCFWFTLLHELKHALSGDGLKNGVLAIDIDLVGEKATNREDKPDFEKEADDFAETTLVPSEELDDFIVRKRPLFSELSIRGFATLHRVHPGVVVGQLQHRGEVAYSKFRNLLVKVREKLVQSALTDGWGYQVPTTI